MGMSYGVSGSPASATLPMNAAQREAERAEVARASAALEGWWSRLRFPARLEQQFAQDGAAARLRYFMLSGWISLVVFIGFLSVDYLMARDVFWLAMQVRLLVFTPLALTLLLAGTLAADWFLKRVPPSWMEAIVLFSGVAAAASLAYILSASRSPMSQYYHVGLMVVIVYGNIVQRLRFWYAIVFSLAVYAMHVGGVLMIPAANPRLIWPMVAMVGGAMVFTLMANYALERDERRRYLLSLRRRHVLQDLGDMQQRLQRLSRVDGLTGVYNRRHFDEVLQQTWQRAQFGNEDVALIAIDVDHFKQYNDHYGHLVGDECLIRIAQTIQDSLRRPADVVARLGGEEFVAILPHASAEVAQAAGERVRHAVEALAMPHERSSTARVVTVSVGVAHCKPRAWQSARSMLALADEALYEAKGAGRNTSVLKVPNI